MSYKYCIVPKCKNTTVTTPNKLFFSIPRDANIRKKWCNIMRRDDKTPLASNSVLYCCEDHFDVETDMENYIKYKMMGGQLKLKKGVLPHKFACQIKNEDKIPVERPGYKKRQQIEYIEVVVNSNICHENLLPQQEFVRCESTSLNKSSDIDPIGDEMPTKLDCPKMDESSSHTNSSSICDSFHHSSTEDTQIDEVEEQVESIQFKKHMQEGTLTAIVREPKLFLGLPSVSYSCVEYLCNYIQKPLIDVLLTIRKIRWLEPNSMLAVHFGVSESTVATRFKETLPKIAQCMQELTFIPSRDKISLNLPIPFRKRYSKVISIIDCFEVQIKKPSTAVHQALTWSQYKNTNTIKYFISITPDGFINFISEGYGGRTSDALILEDCGFLNMLSPGDVVMALRAFKNITHLLERQGCTLLCPPSVSSGTKLSKEEILEIKRIAALRLHVESCISRLMEFKMIASHACIDIKFVKLLDFIVISACGVVNLQE